MPTKDIWLPSENVAARYNKRLRSIRRWKKELKEFPQPVRRGRRLYWSLKELRAFEARFADRFGATAV